MFHLNTLLSIPVLFAATQIILDLFLIVIVLFLLKRITAFDAAKLTTLIDTLKESRRLCKKLEKTVAENATVAGNIDRILNRPGNNETASTVPDSTKQEPVNTDRRKQVPILYNQGRTIEEIADITGLGKGEIEVITALAHQTAPKAG